MPSGLPKAALTAHVTSSLGRFGAVAAFLALAVNGVRNTDPMAVRAAYLVMDTTAWPTSLRGGARVR